MGASSPAESFGRQSLGAVLRWSIVRRSLVAGGLGGVGGWLLGDLTTAALGAIATVVLVVGVVYLLDRTKQIGTNTDGLVVDGGPFGDTQVIPFDEIDLVVRRPSSIDGTLGTASYEIVRTGEPNAWIARLVDGEDFERVLTRRVPAPPEQFQRADETANHFWFLWPEDYQDSIPDSPVVSEDELATALSIDLADANLDGLERVIEQPGTRTLVGVVADGDGERAKKFPDSPAGFDSVIPKN